MILFFETSKDIKSTVLIKISYLGALKTSFTALFFKHMHTQ